MAHVNVWIVMTHAQPPLVSVHALSSYPSTWGLITTYSPSIFPHLFSLTCSSSNSRHCRLSSFQALNWSLIIKSTHPAFLIPSSVFCTPLACPVSLFCFCFPLSTIAIASRLLLSSNFLRVGSGHETRFFWHALFRVRSYRSLMM